MTKNHERLITLAKKKLGKIFNKNRWLTLFSKPHLWTQNFSVWNFQTSYANRNQATTEKLRLRKRTEEIAALAEDQQNA